MHWGERERIRGNPKEFATVRISWFLFFRANISSRGKRMKIDRLNLNYEFGKLRSIFAALAVLALVLCTAFSARGQVTTAAVRGTVTDEQGAALAGADVSITNKGLKGGSNLSVSGSASNGNQWLVDGANNNDTGSQRTILVYPSTESIQEFKIERSSYGAEFGGMSGATINLVTKSGSNDFHGSVYYSGRNDKLNAYDPILKDGCPTPLSPVTCPKNKFRGNDYGYTIGGPVKKGKIFFFWSQEWNKRIEGIVRTSDVPGMAERTGDFSKVASCSFFPSGGLTDPNPGDPGGPFTVGAGGPNVPDVIPQSRLTSQGLLLMTQYPAPTISDPCVNLNWTKSLNTPTPWREENARGDINLSKTLTLMLKFTNDAWTLGVPSAGFCWVHTP